MAPHAVLTTLTISMLLLSIFLIQFFNICDVDLPEKLTYVGNESSVWCQIDDTGSRMCTFKNLCYLPRLRQFIFVLTPRSILSGISENSILKLLELSSVQNHNNLTLKLAVVSDKQAAALNYSVTRQTSVMLLNRFKWDNIMHVIHDDLMPLFFTYISICAGNFERCISHYKLAFVDEGEGGPYSDWYNLFSHKIPLHLHKEKLDTMVCFDECRTGVVRNSIWYQYGFGKPQGSLSDTKLTGEMVKQFSAFIKKKLLGNEGKTSVYTTVLFNRKINRKILNEPFVLQFVKDTVESNFPAIGTQNVFSVDLSANSTQTILSLLVNAKLLIGMHGSAMILSLFLEAGSVVIEIFPYAINSTHVSAVKRLCSLESLGLVYRSWTNMMESNSVAHPEAPPLLGGIAHLPPDQQERIRSIYPVPAVHCCHNPAYLYRMFQDTVVGEDFVEVLHSAFAELKNKSVVGSEHTEFKKHWKKWYFPAEVTDVRCNIGVDKRTVQFSWTPPINVCVDDIVIYKLAIVGGDVAHLSLVSLQPYFSLSLPSHVAGNVSLNIWIKSEVNSTESADVYAVCNIYV